MARIGKRGSVESSDELAYSAKYYFLSIIFIAVVVAAFLTFGVHIRAKYVPPELQQSLHFQRFVNNCFVYVDTDTSRAYPGIIDTSKFLETELNTCYITNIKTKSLSYKLTLTGEDYNHAISTVNFVTSNRRELFPILMYNKGKITPAQLRVDFGPERTP